MMRYLRLIVLFVIGLALILLAMANRELVTISALPADIAALLGVNWSLQLPVFLVIFAAIAAGLLIGFVWEWAREHKHRVTASKSSKAVTKLERELAVLRDSNSTPKDDILALLDRPKG